MTVTEEEREPSVSLHDGPGEIEREEKVIKAWRRKAKGKPMRWRILRAMVACLSLAWMNTSQVQIAMRRLYALKNKTTRDMLEELEEGRSVVQVREDKSQTFKWGATPDGVAFWVGKTQRIPASIALVASTSAFVNTSEV